MTGRRPRTGSHAEPPTGPRQSSIGKAPDLAPDLIARAFFVPAPLHGAGTSACAHAKSDRCPLAMTVPGFHGTAMLLCIAKLLCQEDLRTSVREVSSCTLGPAMTRRLGPSLSVKLVGCWYNILIRTPLLEEDKGPDHDVLAASCVE